MDTETEATQPDGDKLKETGKKWMERIRARLVSRDYERWQKAAEDAEATYSQDLDSNHGREFSFNILHANIETIAPSLYNSTPTPDVRPVLSNKNQEAFDTTKTAAEVLEACIAAQLDDAALDAEMEQSVISMEMAGRGLVRVRFDADTQEQTEVVQKVDQLTGQVVEVEETYITPTNERVYYEVVPWRDYLEGPAQRYDQVPWIAFRLIVPHEDLDTFDQAYIDAQKSPDDKDADEYTVWEIWCKQTGTVYFVRESDGMVLMEERDPLGLNGFFPIHKPADPIIVPGQRVPVVPFTIYEDMAKEVDHLTVRINRILSGLKVRGGIAGNAENIQSIADLDDNQFAVIEDVESAAATGGLEKAVLWWPVDKAVQVLRELYVAREQAKQAVYEITGISDIVRGASNTSETATAQQIKTQWGSLRIQKKQALVQRQVRDLFVLTAELVCTKFSDERIAEIMGYPVDPQVLAYLREGLKQYQVNVESDSTIKADLTRMRGDMAQFLQGAAQYFQVMAPVVQQAGPKAAEPAISLFAAFARTYSLGRQGEKALDDLIDLAREAAKQPQDDTAQKLQQQEAMLNLKEIAVGIQETMNNMQLSQREADREDFKAKVDAASKQAQAGVTQQQTDQDGFKAAAEIALEDEQQRAVKVGE